MKNFWRYLKKILLALVTVALLTVIGITDIKDVENAETWKSSYVRTAFDYTISSPDAAQVKEFRENAAVDKIYPLYVFSGALGSATNVTLWLSDDMADSTISFFNEETLVKGDLSGGGAVLDVQAAKVLGKSVGDTLSIAFSGKTFSLEVSAICMKVDYKPFSDGLVQAALTEEMRAAYGEHAYHFAFLKAKDEAALKTLLADYVGEGNVQTYEEYLPTLGTKPPYMSDEEFEAECRENYEAFRAEGLEAAKRGGNQSTAKADLYEQVRGRVEKTEAQAESIRLWGAVAGCVVFFLVGVLFIVTERKDSAMYSKAGSSFGNVFGRYAIAYLLTAVCAALGVFGILYAYGLGTSFPQQCLPVAIWLSVPVLLAGLLVVFFALIWVGSLYRNSNRGGNGGNGNGGGDVHSRLENRGGTTWDEYASRGPGFDGRMGQNGGAGDPRMQGYAAPRQGAPYPARPMPQQGYQMPPQGYQGAVYYDAQGRLCDAQGRPLYPSAQPMPPQNYQGGYAQPAQPQGQGGQYPNGSSEIDYSGLADDPASRKPQDPNDRRGGKGGGRA